MRTIKAHGLDLRNGFRLDLVHSGDRGTRAAQATEAMLAAGEADLIDTDWLSIARSREDGPGLTAIFPYGRVMGGMVTAAAAGIGDLADLRGRRIGVIRATDKNWVVIRAAFQRRFGFDLQPDVAIEEALSKTTLVQWLEAGYADAAVLPWQLVPRVVADGRFAALCDVLDLLEELGSPPVATTFFAVRPDFALARAELIEAFVAAYCAAVRLMRGSERAWLEAVAAPGDSPEMLAALRAAWSRRICCEWGPDSLPQLQVLSRILENAGGIGGQQGFSMAPDRIWPAGSLGGPIPEMPEALSGIVTNAGAIAVPDSRQRLPG